ncbi:MAG TPA: mitofilin family membrane protein [Stellaceae bacterium]|nr:mitofilin family membrane protein [Stellaceae bacterium]
MTDQGEERAAHAHAYDAESGVHHVAEPVAEHAQWQEAPPTPSRHTGRVVAIAVSVALIVGLLVAGSAPFWTSLLPWGGAGEAALTAQIAEAEAARRAADARVARLEVQMAQIESAARAAAPSTALASLGDRVAALERRPDAAAQSAQQIAQLRQDLAGLASRLDADEARLGKLATQAEGGGDRMLFLAIAGLRAAMAGSGPYQGQLAAVEALAQNNEAVMAALQPLAGEARTGIPSTAVLAERFARETAPAIARAAATESVGDVSWGDRMLAKLRSLVVIRRIDGGGDPANIAVARAERALDAGDLAGAVAAVRSLSGTPAKAAAGWLGVAEQRLASERALDELSHEVAQRIAGEGR